MSEEFLPRTIATHSTQCASLDGPLHDHFASTFGISHDSILNTSRYFHVTEGSIPDVMHDVLEGVLPYEVKELLKHLTNEGIISFSELSSAMESFPYTGHDLLNKPTPLALTTLRSSDHKLKQTGMLNFIIVIRVKVDVVNVYIVCSGWEIGGRGGPPNSEVEGLSPP